VSNDENIGCEFEEEEKIKVNTNMRNIFPVLLSSSKCQNLAHHFYKLLEERKYIMSLESLFEFFICEHSKLINKFYTRYTNLSSLSLFICHHFLNECFGNFRYRT